MHPATLAIIGRDWFNNLIHSKIEKNYSLLFYITEPVDWVIKQVGIDILTNLKAQKKIKTLMTTTHKGIYNQIIHFGSVNTFLDAKGSKNPDESNKVVLTWFHVVPDDPRNRLAKEAHKYADIVHTSSAITKRKLIEIGIPEDKIIVIPLGVDLTSFKPASLEEKQKIREEIGIPKDKIVIGSFQKDGAGWGEGLEPKWIKGPDIFVKAVDELRKKYDIFVLLLGPARGYVKRELEKRGILYKHIFLKNYLEIPKYYNALDLYLVTSREEGGPKAVLEAMATGIPIVSTRVGMASDIIIEGYNGFLVDVEDVEMLKEKAKDILNNENISKKIAENGLNTVRDFSWEEIAKSYHDKIYSKLLMKKNI